MPEISHAYFHGKDARTMKAAFKETYERLFHGQHGRLPDPEDVASELGVTITITPRRGQVDRWDVYPRAPEAP